MNERSGKILLGFVLLITGSLLFLDMLGIDGGDIFGFLIPGLIMVYGAKKLMAGEGKGGRWWGIMVFLFGFLMMIGKLDLLFTSALSIVVIYFGFKLLRSRNRDPHEAPSILEREWAKKILREDELDHFERKSTAKQQ
ncbi:LiaF transmembrane domain-containing protein [Brevibacillus dissolubilis]|uniref:LiaF transmembrane domain-containing protein n=1 Tax=Brevibacillus dissolubilis TaxID=1844116 RepID=UPI0011167104|nr:hypothetical protein [Brevibacillus dissolubilis]